MTEPTRTCVGCGASGPRSGLVRVKAEGMAVRIDSKRTGGRGAWLHPAEACLERALKRRAFGRALRAEGVTIDADALRRGLTGNARKD